MTLSEAIYRAWVILGLGFSFLLLFGVQLWMGKAFVGYGWRKSAWAIRKKEPYLFWTNILPLAALGLFAIGLGLTRLM
jgi:uncharacterized iron-regulated membrane protein